MKPTVGTRLLRTLLEGLLASFSTTASQALDLNDLFGFFEVGPQIPSCSPADISELFELQAAGYR